MNGRYTFYRTLIVVFTVAGLYLLWQLAEVVVVLIGAVIVASAIRPYVNLLHDRGCPRGLAVLLVYGTALAGVGTLLVFSIPPLIAVISELVREGSLIARLSEAILDLSVRVGYQDIGVDLFFRLREEWRQLPLRLEAVAQREGVSYLQRTFTFLGQFILAFVVAYYWLTERDKFQNLLLSITPVRHRDRTEAIFNDVEETMGSYIRGTALLMLSIGLSAFIGLFLIGVPHSLPLALLAGLFEAIPLVGATLGALPAVLVAFSVSSTTGILTILLFVLIQFVENNVLVPRIHEHSVGLNPLVVLIAVVAGGTVGGIIGALLAIPVAGAFQVILRNLVVDPMQEEAKESHEEHGIPIFDLEEVEDAQTEGIIIAGS